MVGLVVNIESIPEVMKGNSVEVESCDDSCFEL